MLYKTKLNGVPYNVSIYYSSKDNCEIEFTYKGKKYTINEILNKDMNTILFDACVKSLLGSKIAAINRAHKTTEEAQKIAIQYGLKVVNDFPD